MGAGVSLNGKALKASECSTVNELEEGIANLSRKNIKIQFKSNDVEKLCSQEELESKAGVLTRAITTIAEGCESAKSQSGQLKFQVYHTGRMREHYYASVSGAQESVPLNVITQTRMNSSGLDSLKGRAEAWKCALEAQFKSKGGSFHYLSHDEEARLEAHCLLHKARDANEDALKQVCGGRKVWLDEVLWVSVGSSSTQGAAVAGDGDGGQSFCFPMAGGARSMLGTSHFKEDSEMGNESLQQLAGAIAEWVGLCKKRRVILHNSIGYLAPEGQTEPLVVTQDPGSKACEGDHNSSGSGSSLNRVQKLAEAIQEKCGKDGEDLQIYLWPRSNSFRTQPDNSWTSALEGVVFDVGGGSAGVSL